ncbi:hypothetical protein [Mycolicibacterium farcinogenes]|uniref:Uncharacterized protein n=1 Tax=Mycolicibacterium farcinogenes TaxID=1802 RepID=A0ACD1FHD2_MYCFR|nr:hypothetical protein [Mycolicibacterium farcinogenes]QZH66451.1 hypothetical protein K6L26_01685 [Mycolicibacterium farcinogenes]
MTQAGIVTQVERVRITTKSRGHTTNLQKVEQDLRDLNSLLVVSALRATRPYTMEGFRKSRPGVLTSDFRKAQQNADAINLSEFRINSPWTAVLEQVADAATGGGVLAGLLYLYNRFLKTASGSIDVQLEYYEAKQKKSEIKNVLIRNKIVEQRLKQELKLETAKTEAHKRLIDAGLKGTRGFLSAAQREALENEIIGAARALTFIESIEPDPLP